MDGRRLQRKRAWRLAPMRGLDGWAGWPSSLDWGARPSYDASYKRQDFFSNIETPGSKRTSEKEYATFSAEPLLIDSGAFTLFEIRSVAEAGSVPRWRCVARDGVAECLGAPVRIRYLPDERIVLTAKL